MDTTSIYWQLYPTQEQAFDAQRASGKDTMVTSMDKTMDGRKTYAVTSLLSSYRHVMSSDNGQHQYELLMPLAPLRLYFDAEFSVPLNPTLDAELSLCALVHCIQRAYSEIPNRPHDVLPSNAVCVETSHRMGVKISYHGKIDARYGIVANMTHQRAFWARVRYFMDISIAALDESATQLRIVSKHKLPNGPEERIQAYFWDGNVYTKHRLMRFLGACKWPRAGTEPSYLVPYRETRESVSFEKWRASLITVAFIEPLPDVVTLELSDAWFKLADVFWPTPVVTSVLPLTKKTTSTAAASHAPRIADTVIQNYLEFSFPSDAVATMLTMNGTVDLQYRHLALSTLDGSYVHHFEHTTRQELNRALHWRNAAAIHVGEATTSDTQGREIFQSSVHPIGRYTFKELCFDVDVTDYDKPFMQTAGANLDADEAEEGDTVTETSVRWCDCKHKKQLCKLCWYMIEASASFLRDMVVRRMGIDKRHVLWVFSGSKGIHMWVNAAECLHLTHEERVFLVQRYINVDLEKALTRDTRDPLIEDLFVRLIYPHFTRHCIARRQFLAPEQAPRILNQWADWIMPFAPSLASTWRAVRAATSEDVWTQIIAQNNTWLMTHAMRTTGNVPNPLAWVVAHYAWPRIDTKVTTERRKTLKSPFSVHAETHRVALPILCPGEGRQKNAMYKTAVDVNTAAHLAKSADFQQAVKRLYDWCKWYNK
jgi:DNA primase small subunit